MCFLPPFVIPAGPPPAAHGSPGIQLTFPATRPSRTIPSLKSDIRRTGGGDRQRRGFQPKRYSGLKLAGAAPQPRNAASLGEPVVCSLTPGLSGSSPASVTHRRWRRKAERAAGGGARWAANHTVLSNSAFRFSTPDVRPRCPIGCGISSNRLFPLLRQHTLVTTSSHFPAKCLIAGWDYLPLFKPLTDLLQMCFTSWFMTFTAKLDMMRDDAYAAFVHQYYCPTSKLLTSFTCTRSFITQLESSYLYTHYLAIIFS